MKKIDFGYKNKGFRITQHIETLVYSMNIFQVKPRATGLAEKEDFPEYPILQISFMSVDGLDVLIEALKNLREVMMEDPFCIKSIVRVGDTNDTKLVDDSSIVSAGLPTSEDTTDFDQDDEFYHVSDSDGSKHSPDTSSPWMRIPNRKDFGS